MDVARAGVAASYRLLAEHDARGEWVWVLDDDDECTHAGLVADLRRIVTEKPQTELVVVRMNHGPLGVLPDAATWGGPPVHGHIGASAYITRRDVWMAHRAAYLSLRYESDCDFAKAVWASNPAVVWHDVVASRVQRISYGAAEYAVAMPEEHR